MGTSLFSELTDFRCFIITLNFVDYHILHVTASLKFREYHNVEFMIIDAEFTI